MDLKEFGLFVAEAREKSGFPSQRQLAIASGVSNGTIARIEAGTQKASPETIKTLSNYLKSVSYEELMQNAGYISISAGSGKTMTMTATHLLNEQQNEYTTDIETIRLVEEHAAKLGFTSSADPRFKKMLSDALEMIRIARQQDH